MKAPYRRMIMSHMLADTEQELMEMARAIGVDTKWFQGDHFDICQTKKKKAVALGAVEITMREAVTIRRRFREGNQS